MGKLVEVVGKVTELDGSVCTTTAMTKKRYGIYLLPLPVFHPYFMPFWIWGGEEIGLLIDSSL